MTIYEKLAGVCPCNSCVDKYLACHDNCIKYKDWRVKYDEIKNKENDIRHKDGALKVVKKQGIENIRTLRNKKAVFKSKKK